MRVLDQVAVEALAVADWCLQADRVLDELEQRPDALGRKAALLGDLRQRLLAVQLLCEHAAGAHDLAYLLGHVDREPDRAPLVGERTRDRLPDPPRRVGRKLVAELVVEIVDRADTAEIALLDQVEERDAGLRVVP